MGLFTEILPDEDWDTGIHRREFSTAVSVWSFMQNRAAVAGVTVAEAAIAFNTTPELIRQAAEDNYWMFLSPEHETDPTKQIIEHEGV